MNSGYRGFSGKKAASISPFNPDKVPASPSPWDDEFEKSVLDPKWTVYEDVSGAYLMSFQNSWITLTYNSTATNTFRYVTIRQNIPPGPWKFRAKFSVAPGYDYTGSVMGPVVISTGKTLAFQTYHHNTYEHRLIGNIDRFTGSTFNSSQSTGIRVSSPIVYQEVENDGTNCYFRLSADGVNFLQIYSEAIASHLAASPTGFLVGLHPYNQLAGNIFKPSVYIDWFRRIS